MARQPDPPGSAAPSATGLSSVPGAASGPVTGPPAAGPRAAPGPGVAAATASAAPLLVAAVVVHDPATDRIVLLQRGERARFGRGMWDLPIGKSEPGEPVTATAVCELHEETGLTVRPEDLALVHVVHAARGADAPSGFLTVVFATRTWTGDLENREPGKHARVRWAPAHDLPGPLVPSTARALHHHLTGGPRLTLHGWP